MGGVGDCTGVEAYSDQFVDEGVVKGVRIIYRESQLLVRQSVPPMFGYPQIDRL